MGCKLQDKEGWHRVRERLIIHCPPPFLFSPSSWTPGGKLLDQFKSHWDNEYQDVPRTVAQILSGSVSDGGVAWASDYEDRPGSICDWYDHPDDNYAYSLVGIHGAFLWSEDQVR